MQLIKKFSLLLEIIVMILLFFGCTVNFELSSDARDLEKLELEKTKINIQYHQKKSVYIRIKAIKPHRNNGKISVFVVDENRLADFISCTINGSKRCLEIKNIKSENLTVLSNREYRNKYDLKIKSGDIELCSLQINFTENRDNLEQTLEQTNNILKTVNPTTASLVEDNLINLDFDIKYISKSLYDDTSKTIEEANKLLKENFSQYQADNTVQKLEHYAQRIKKETVKGKKKIKLSQPFAYVILGLFGFSVVVMLLSLFMSFNLKFSAMRKKRK